MNNSFNVITKLTSIEIIYEFKMKNKLTAFFENIADTFMTNHEFKKNLNETRLRFKQKASNAMTFENVKIKIMYDHKHKLFMFKKKKQNLFQIAQKI